VYTVFNQTLKNQSCSEFHCNKTDRFVGSFLYTTALYRVEEGLASLYGPVPFLAEFSLSHLELLGTMSRSRLDWGSSDFVNRSSVHDVRDLYVNRLAPLAFHLGLQGRDGTQICWPHVPRMSEIHRLPNLRSVYPRSPWLWFLFGDTRPKQLNPELPRHGSSSRQLCSVWTKPTGVCASDLWLVQLLRW